MAAIPDVEIKPQDVHRYLQQFGWNLEKRRGKYPTKYVYNPDSKEQFKLIVKEYCRMEEEKDQRQYGSLLDALARMEVGSRIEPRWAETMKPVATLLESGEYAAIAGSAILWNATRSPELKNGYLAQVMDEVRHTVQTGYINSYMAKHSCDPAGHADARRIRYMSPLWKAVKRAATDGFVAGDPVECSLNLQLVAEACFTNPLIVALTEWAAANGDEITPTVFLSIETDELRHMANGYQTIVSVIDYPENHKYLQTDLENTFWIQHKLLSPFVGATLEYGAVNKVEPWVVTWDRWVYQDWASIWLGRLSKFGIKTPRNLPEAKQEAYWGHHSAALSGRALWPLAGFRTEAPNANDMEWFEKYYPGWYTRYGTVYDAWKEMGFEDPASHFIPYQWTKDNNIRLYICRTCQLPTVMPDLAGAARKTRILEYEGRLHALCSDHCERMFLMEPERYKNTLNFLEEFDGWDLADLVVKFGALRTDGKTLTSQPHLRSERMWTLDDLRACKVTIEDPLKKFHGGPTAY
jgi:methane monooxygenase component A alpha chain